MTRRYYRIYIAESLSNILAHSFSGLRIECLAGNGMIISGPLEDQAALHGVLARVRDLGLTLVRLDSAPVRPGTEGARDWGEDENGDGDA